MQRILADTGADARVSTVCPLVIVAVVVRAKRRVHRVGGRIDVCAAILVRHGESSLPVMAAYWRAQGVWSRVAGTSTAATIPRRARDGARRLPLVACRHRNGAHIVDELEAERAALALGLNPYP